MGGEPGPEGAVGGREGVQAEVGEGWVSERGVDWFRSEENGLLCVGENQSRKK